MTTYKDSHDPHSRITIKQEPRSRLLKIATLTLAILVIAFLVYYFLAPKTQPSVVVEEASPQLTGPVQSPPNGPNSNPPASLANPDTVGPNVNTQ